MNKIKQLHQFVCDKINPFSIHDTHRHCERAKMNDKIASKSAKITEQIAIEFAEWVINQNWNEKELNFPNNKSTKKLYQEFFKKKQ